MNPANGEGNNLSSSTSAQPCRCFSFAEIRLATKDFDEELVIGKGGFGKVYKGHISNGEGEACTVVAIKRLDSMSNQGAPEFRAEIEMLSKLRHCHLVSLIGYCDDYKEMILVYEYMPHGTLDDHLHKAGAPLDWVQRLKIAIGAGRGLDYLHTGFGTHQGVIHRDVKSSNILLDENWAARISDFGLSKVGRTNQPSSYIYASVKGTFGYLDPEYFLTRRLTRKTDVFAFGVVLFELLSGRLAVDIRFGEEQCSLVRWAQKCVKDRKIDEIVDPNVKGRISPKCLKQFVQLADRCLHGSLEKRPNMTEVVASLQLLLALQEKSDNCPESPGIMGMMHKYFVLSPKTNSEMNTVLAKIPPSPLRVALSPGRFSMTPKLDRVQSFHLNMNQIARATRNFSPSLRLGEGGFGAVYKAQLQDGQVVAVKRAKKECFDTLRSEFSSEVELLAKIDHHNLVKLLSYIDTGDERLIIMEYVPNGTLREHLDGVRGNYLDFSQRLDISMDIAHGLTYLHLYAEKQIIHRDVKSSNILVTQRMRAKITDFGFARLRDAESKGTHLVTNVRGTVGYLDPEYMRTCQLTPKSDVHSFGVLLIEILTGRRPIKLRSSPEETVTIRWAFGKYIEGKMMDLVDPQMKEVIDREIFGKMLDLAFRCAAPTHADRPDMKVVGEQLWAIRMEYLRHGTRR